MTAGGSIFIFDGQGIFFDGQGIFFDGQVIFFMVKIFFLWPRYLFWCKVFFLSIWAKSCRTGKKCSACHKTALTPRIVLAKRLALATCPFGLLDNYMARVFTAIFTVLGAFLRAEKYFWSFGNKPLNPKFKKCPKNTLNVGNSKK